MDTKFSGSANYVASRDLMETVNIAVALQKPLLIKGEPDASSFPSGGVSDGYGKVLFQRDFKRSVQL